MIPTIDEFAKWRDSLSPMDRLNFDTLLTLPKAEEIIGKLDEGMYRNMAMSGLALMRAMEESDAKLG